MSCAQSTTSRTDTGVNPRDDFAPDSPAGKARQLISRAEAAHKTGRVKQSCRLAYEAARRFIKSGQLQEAGQAALFAIKSHEACVDTGTAHEHTADAGNVLRNVPDLLVNSGRIVNKDFHLSCGICWACWLLLARNFARMNDVNGAARAAAACYAAAIGMLFSYDAIEEAAESLVTMNQQLSAATLHLCQQRASSIVRHRVGEMLAKNQEVGPYRAMDISCLLHTVRKQKPILSFLILNLH